MATAAELARDASHKTALLQQDVNLLREEVQRLELVLLRERVAVLENAVTRLEKVAEDVKPIPAILDRLNKLEEEKRESYKRVWQFFFVLGGVVLGVVGNLVVSALKPSGVGQPK